MSFAIGVKGQTPFEKLVEIRKIIKDIVESQPQTSFDRTDLKELTASSLGFEIVYYVLTFDYNVFMDTQHTINLELVRRFAEEGIEFA